MTREAFNRWLESYLTHQEKNNPEIIKELFAENGVYWWGPYSEPRHGLKAIYEHHRNALSHQEDIKYEYEILAVTEEYGITRFSLALNDLLPDEPKRYEGIFQVYLNEDSKCTLFKEWYNFTM